VYHDAGANAGMALTESFAMTPSDHDAEGHVHGPDCNHDHDHGEEKPKKATAKKTAAKKKSD